MKYVLIFQTIATAVAVAVTSVDGLFETIVLTGAVVAAVAVIYGKAVVPAYRFNKKVVHAVDVIISMPLTVERLDERVQRLERILPRPAGGRRMTDSQEEV